VMVDSARRRKRVILSTLTPVIESVLGGYRADPARVAALNDAIRALASTTPPTRTWCWSTCPRRSGLAAATLISPDGSIPARRLQFMAQVYCDPSWRISESALMRLAVLGTPRPGSLQRFETLAEELGARLAGGATRSRCTAAAYVPPTACASRCPARDPADDRRKYFETVVHTALSTLHALFQRYDAILVSNGANAIFTLWPRLVDGRGAQRGRPRPPSTQVGAPRAWYWLSIASRCGSQRDRHRCRGDWHLLPRETRRRDRLHRLRRLAERTRRDVLDRYGLEPAGISVCQQARA